MTRLTILCLLVSSVFFHASCTLCGIGRHEETLRVASPDSVVEAVLVRCPRITTAREAYRVYIVPAGQEPQRGHDSFHATDVSGLELAWREVAFLEITYKEAVIYKFRNFWQSSDVDDFRYVVELRLVPPPESWSVPKRRLVPPVSGD